MAGPVVAIVGRPNSGKSSLFNRVSGRTSAIVEEMSGVTRDRNYMDVQYGGKAFVIVDTGGFYIEAEPDIERQVREQAMFAISEADLIIHLLDGKEGISPADMELAGLIRKSGKQCLTAINKIDGTTKEDRIYDFYGLGVEELIAVSAKTGYNFDEFMERLISYLPSSALEAYDYPMIAVIGRPNVGKSTFVNSLLGKPRMIVSQIPGTTRDSIDSVCTYYGHRYLLIDTAGIRRRARGYSIERFAMLRAMKSIGRADVCLMMLDATEGILKDDQKIAGMVHMNSKGAIFLLNKWDLIENPDETYKRLTSEIRRKLWFLEHAPMLTISGVERKRVTKVFPIIDEVIKERQKRISTRQLNELLKSAPTPTLKGKKIKLRYITQVGIKPPTFVVFTNNPEGIKEDYMRYLEKLLRQRYSFKGTPIKIFKRGYDRHYKKGHK
ncbi:MAG: ribosome biogenesis GTPase Der [Nitrospirae bacterium]|nr:ribosome biogenesis GTPase Der [Nitrospirota bacterium]